MEEKTIFWCVMFFAVSVIIQVFLFHLGFNYGDENGALRIKKEAFQNNFMTKEIDKDDKVVYRWVEAHKVGLDYSE